MSLEEIEALLHQIAHQVIGFNTKAMVTEIALIALMKELLKSSPDAQSQVETVVASIEVEIEKIRADQFRHVTPGPDYLGPASQEIQARIRALLE